MRDFGFVWRQGVSSCSRVFHECILSTLETGIALIFSEKTHYFTAVTIYSRTGSRTLRLYKPIVLVREVEE